MNRSLRAVILIALLAGAWPAAAQDARLIQDTACHCDPEQPETMQARQCGLCREAEKQPDDVVVFFLKDINPRKPNRWLALPRQHGPGMHGVSALSRAQRAAFWKGAIEKARAMWGGEWGLAINGNRVRSQCHGHVHIGRLLEEAREIDALLSPEGQRRPRTEPRVVKSIEDIPAPEEGEGMWVHPAGGKYHVHIEAPATATEFILLR